MVGLVNKVVQLFNRAEPRFYYRSECGLDSVFVCQTFVKVLLTLSDGSIFFPTLTSYRPSIIRN